MILKPLFTRFENLFLTPPPNGESRHPQAGVFCGPNQNVYDGEKSSEKIQSFRENRGKRFFFGAIWPSTGGKLSKRKFVSYMGARVLLFHGSKMTIFEKKFSCVLRFCALLMTSLILEGVKGTKNRIVIVEFQSECYVKILSTGNDV